MYLVGTYFLLLNPTWLQIFKIQSKDAVNEREAAMNF
jgi:hypothetical protein